MGDPTVVERIRTALESPDPAAFKDLLAPDVRWGPPDDEVSGCHNRDQVVEWYGQRRQAGVRSRVTEVVAGADKLLIGMKVTGTEGDEEVDRWQVLTLRDGLVADIRGFEDRDQAAARAGVPA